MGALPEGGHKSRPYMKHYPSLGRYRGRTLEGGAVLGRRIVTRFELRRQHERRIGKEPVPTAGSQRPEDQGIPLPFNCHGLRIQARSIGIRTAWFRPLRKILAIIGAMSALPSAYVGSIGQG